MNSLSRVLIIEDNEHDIEFLNAIYFDKNKDKYQIQSCTSLESALLLANEDFQVILTDLNLPDSRGEETVYSILNSFPDTPTIVMTENENKELIDKVINLGIHDYVIKGQLTHDAIDRIINFALARHRYYSQIQGHNKALRKLTQKMSTQINSPEDESRVINSIEIKHLLHDLKSTIGLMMGSIDMINSSKSAANDKAIKVINKSLQFLNSIIDQKFYDREIEQSVLAAINEVTQLSKQAAKDKGLELKVNILTGTLWTNNATKLKQILLNLVSNAIKYTESGKVEIDALIESNDLVINISDTGKGILAENINSIFEDEVKIKVKGSTGESHGHGLFIVKSLLHKTFNGEISVRSQVNTGTDFTIRIPVSSFYKKPSDKFNILLIDDCEDHLIITKHFLEDLDAHIETKVSFKHSIQLLKKKKFDLIISDYNTEKETLPEFISDLRDNINSDTPLIIVSGEAETSLEISNKIYSEHIQKPIEKESLIKKVKEYII